MRQFKVLFFAAAILLAGHSAAFAQTPRMFSYQGLALDASTGKPITNGPHSVTVNLYTVATGGTAIYTETFSGGSAPNFTGGLFDVLVGSVTSIPSSVAFDKEYFLGVAIDGNAELAPRTPVVSAPYAIHAATADALSSGGTGVSSVNGQTGTVVVKAGNGASITTANDTVTISSTVIGGTGVQGVQNADASISVTNPNGPTAMIAVANGGVTVGKISSGLIGGNAIAGTVLTANGTGGAAWLTVSGGGGSLTLPFAGSINTAGGAFGVTNTGAGLLSAGQAGIFANANALSQSDALVATTNGTPTSRALYASNTGFGRAGYFEVTNAASSAITLQARSAGSGTVVDILDLDATNTIPALQSNNQGLGSAGLFQVSNNANSANVLEATTTGSGNAVKGTSTSSAGVFGQATTTGAGIHGQTGSGATSAQAAIFDQVSNTTTGTLVQGTVIGTGMAESLTINNAGNTSTALQATTNGTGSAADFENTNANTGAPTVEVKSSSTNSNIIGIHSTILASTNGPSNIAAAIKGEHNGTNGVGIGIWGRHAGTGVGVYGTVDGNGGYGIQGQANGAGGTALLGTYSGNGAAGIDLELNNGYIKVSGTNRTAYIHTTSAANLDPNFNNSTVLAYPAMAATDILIVSHNFGAVRLNTAPYVWWNAAAARWEIGMENNAVMPNGEKFNILVIRQ